MEILEPKYGLFPQLELLVLWDMYVTNSDTEIILNTISKDRMAQIYSVKYIQSLDLPKPTM